MKKGVLFNTISEVLENVRSSFSEVTSKSASDNSNLVADIFSNAIRIGSIYKTFNEQLNSKFQVKYSV